MEYKVLMEMGFGDDIGSELRQRHDVNSEPGAQRVRAVSGSVLPR